MDPQNTCLTSPPPGWSRPWLAVALACGLTSAAHADRTVTGRIVYGTINDDIGEATPPTNLVFPSLPVKHVKVELNDGLSFPAGSPDITDDDGRFSITFGGTPNLTLVTKAENDYAAVKKHHGFGQNWFGDDVLKTRVDISALVDYGVCLNGDTCDIGNVTVVSDVVDSFNTHNGNLKNYVSRAFYITTAAHASGTRVESVHGASLPGEKVRVRLGIDSTAWYYQIDNTIYLSNTDAVTFWHEYGHFVEDKIGAFALVPPYFSHQECTEITNGGVNDLGSPPGMPRSTPASSTAATAQWSRPSTATGTSLPPRARTTWRTLNVPRARARAGRTRGPSSRSSPTCSGT